MLPNFLVSAPKLCIFGLNESRFPISALWVGTSGSSSRISSHFARPSDRRWRMSKPRKQDGVVYARKDGKILWIRYWGRNGKPCRESRDRKSTRLNSSHLVISYAVFCLKKK